MRSFCEEKKRFCIFIVTEFYGISRSLFAGKCRFDIIIRGLLWYEYKEFICRSRMNFFVHIPHGRSRSTLTNRPCICLGGHLFFSIAHKKKGCSTAKFGCWNISLIWPSLLNCFSALCVPSAPIWSIFNSVTEFASQSYCSAGTAW